MIVEPYLNMDGRGEEAIEFYKKALGAKVEMMMRYKESPEPHSPGPGLDNKVMHSSLTIGVSRIMISDGHCTNKGSFTGISLSLRTADDTEAKKVFTALSDGGKVTMPMAKTFFSSAFGMVTDRFGVSWMVLTGH